MDVKTPPPEVADAIERRHWDELRAFLAGWPPPDLADLLLALGKEDRVLTYRALPRDRAAAVFALLERDQQTTLLHDLTDPETRELLAALPPDDRTHLLEELPGQATRRVLNLLSPEDLEEARWLLGYPKESVGRLMTPDYVAVRPEWPVNRALAHIRAHGTKSETINRIFVVDDEWRLIDDIDLRRFILSDPDARVSDIMDHRVASIDSGGNAGSQSATLMVRALATGDVHLSDWLRLLRRELGVAALLGLTMAVGVSAISWFRAPDVLVVVAASMVLLVVWGSLIGMSLPFVLTRLGRDPAAASAPLITSLADISGVLIYFGMASWLLGR